MIGIGVTTHNRLSVLRETLEAIERFTEAPYRLVCVSDQSTDGTDEFLREYQPQGACVAFEPIVSPFHFGSVRGKNQCLLALADCDFIFLLDDDCRPRAHGWEAFFLEAHQATGIHHFSFLTRAHGEPSVHSVGEFRVLAYPKSGGVFMTISPRMIRDVGGFNPRFQPYGYFHASYSERVHRAGLQAGLGAFLSLEGTDRMLHALDYDLLDDSLDISPISSVTTKERRKHLAHNYRVYNADRRGPVYQPISVEKARNWWDVLPWIK